MKKNKYRVSEGSKLKKCLFGTLTITFGFLLFSLVATLFLYSTDNPTANVALISMIAFILSCGIGTFINMKLFYDGSFNSPLISSVIAIALYLSISAIASGSFTVPALINSVSVAFASLLALFLGKKRTVKSIHRKR